MLWFMHLWVEASHREISVRVNIAELQLSVPNLLGLSLGMDCHFPRLCLASGLGCPRALSCLCISQLRVPERSSALICDAIKLWSQL
jgi:hypothetical protein